MAEFTKWHKYAYLLDYMDMSYHVKYDEKRRQLHSEIIDKYFEDKDKKCSKNKKLIIVCGSYASGKNYIINNLLYKFFDKKCFVHADLDDIRKYISEYSSYVKENPWESAYKTNKEAGYLVELIQKHALFNGYNLIFNGSLKDTEWHYSYLDWIHNKFTDYNGIIIYVGATWEKILERSIERAERDGRSISLSVLKESSDSAFLSFNKIKMHPMIKGYGEINNSQNNATEENLEYIRNCVILTHLLHLLTYRYSFCKLGNFLLILNIFRKLHSGYME